MAPEPKPWAVVVPVKRLAVAKTRLAVDPALRHELALAMAVDTVRACLGAPSVIDVLVVTDDAEAAVQMRALGAWVVADVPDAGLNPALQHGARVLSDRHPGAGVVAVSSDLPALTGTTVEAMLAVASTAEAACVADAAGTGTTALTGRSYGAFRPSFGAGSLRLHVEMGAVDITAEVGPQLRRDVDTVEELADAIRLGCGEATRQVLAAHPGWDGAAARR